MKAILLVTASLTLLSFAGIGGSTHCNGDVIDLGGVAYIDVRDAASQNIWVYVESNGTPGLQSGGPGPFDGAGGLLTQVDPCDHPNPDTLVF